MNPARALVLALLVLVAALPLQAFELSGGWTTVRAPNLIIYSNARDSITKGVMMDLERMRIALAHIMGLRVDAAVPTTIFLFESEASFGPLRKALLGDRARDQPGMFVRTGDGYFIAMQTDSRGGVNEIAYHELAHSMTEATVTGLPLWYREGIAEFYSTFTPIGKAVKVGVAPKSHLDFLADRGLMPLRKVLVVDQRSSEYNEAARVGEFYATSWLFVHYLLVGSPERAGQLGRFLALLDAKKPYEEAFRATFKTTLEHFDGELWSYLNRPMKQAVSYNFPQLGALKVPPPTKVEAAEVLRALDPLLKEADAP